jgi:DNA-binding IclR family transcriptional regulator
MPAIASFRRPPSKSPAASKAPAISRAIAILRLLGDSSEPLGLHAIAGKLGLARSSCLYVLRTLLQDELVSLDPESKKYSLEAGVLTLARKWLKQNRFIEHAQPAMDAISQTFRVTVAGMHIVGLQHIVAVAVSQSNSSIHLSVQIGSRFPALISATGRCVAAFGGHSDADIETRFKALRWDEPLTLTQWKAQVLKTRAQGIAVDEGHYMAGLTVIAVPVWTGGKLSHALAAVGPGGALKRNDFPKLKKALQSTAKSLTALL